MFLLSDGKTCADREICLLILCLIILQLSTKINNKYEVVMIFRGREVDIMICSAVIIEVCKEGGTKKALDFVHGNISEG